MGYLFRRRVSRQAKKGEQEARSELAHIETQAKPDEMRSIALRLSLKIIGANNRSPYITFKIFNLQFTFFNSRRSLGAIPL